MYACMLSVQLSEEITTIQTGTVAKKITRSRMDAFRGT